jgi:hypothetical protein
MKKLFSLLVSFHLILTPVAFAAEPTSQNASAVTAATATADVGTNASYDKQSQSNGGYDFYAKQVLAISTSIIGANIISQCFSGLKVPSIATFMAGSLVHIGSELAGAKAQNENHNRNMEELKLVKENMKREGGQIQREILLRKKLEEEQTRDFIQSRIKWMMAVTAIYTASMGLAIYEEMSGHSGGLAAGTTSCTTVAAELASPCGTGYAACYAKEMAACTAASPAGAISTLPNFANPALVQVAEAQCAAQGPYLPGCTAYLTTYLAVAYGACTPFSPSSGMMGTIMAKGVVAAYSMGVGQTGQSKMSSYTVMLSGLLMLLVPSLQSIVMAAYNLPIPRAVTFGASAAVAGLITTGLMQRKKIAEENIAKLEEVLADFRVKTDDNEGIDLGPSTNGTEVIPGSGELALSNGTNNTTLKKYDIKSLNGATALKTCMANQNESFEFSGSACANPIQIKKPTFDVKNGVKSLNSLGTLANDLANAVSSGDNEKANILAGQIGSQAASVKEINKSLQDALNKKLKAENKPEVDFDKEIKNNMNTQESSFNKAASSKGMSQTSLSSTGGGSLVTGSATTAAVDANALNAANGIIKNGVTGGGAFSAGEFDLSKLNGTGVSTETVEDPNAGNAQVASLEDNLASSKPNQSDISPESDISIFKQVSDRYFLNYNKIFKRKEITPVAVPEATK